MENLFEMEITRLRPVDEIILGNLRDGQQFYSVTQSAKLLGLSCNQVRYAIENYRLDAFLFYGEYRIPFNALLNFNEDDMKDDYLRYFLSINDMALLGVYALNFEGRFDEVLSSLRDKHIPSEAVATLLEKGTQYHYDDMPGDEKDVSDWYEIEQLKLPYEAPIYEYAYILGVKPEHVADELCVTVQSIVEFPDIYDLLVEHEIANLPIPFTVAYKHDREEYDKDQLFLF